MHFTLSDDQQVPVEIRRRKGTRHLKLSIGHHNQIVLSVPYHCSDKVALEFAAKQRGWIVQQIQKTPRSRGLMDWLQEHPRISASGDVFHVSIQQVFDRQRADYTFTAEGSELVLRIPGSIEGAEMAVLQLVRRFAKDSLSCRVPYHAKRLGLAYSKLSVRDQSSRWGSCSSSRGISLNWRLVLLSPELQDYVILHELAHLTEMNHSHRFWALLDSYDTNRKGHEAQLDSITAEIMRVGRV